MDRINHSTATPDRMFTAGNPAASIPATVMTPAFANGVQEELCNVVEGAGLALDPEDDTQLDQAIDEKIAAALLGVSTPAQFDNDTSLATTAFVQRALGNLQGWQQLESATTLTAAHCGRRINLAGGVGFTTTLPLLASLIPGARIHLSNYGPAIMTIARQGSDLIYAPRESVSAMTSLTLSPGDTLALESNGGGWVVYGGSVALQYASGAFAASLAAAGYQKLPSGLIIQWGNWTANVSAGAATAVTFPMTFPSAVYSVALSPNYTSTATTTAWKDTLTTSGFNGHCSVVTGDSVHYVAIGK